MGCVDAKISIKNFVKRRDQYDSIKKPVTINRNGLFYM